MHLRENAKQDRVVQIGRRQRASEASCQGDGGRHVALACVAILVVRIASIAVKCGDHVVGHVFARCIEHDAAVAQANDAREIRACQFHLVQAAYQHCIACLRFLLQYPERALGERRVECGQRLVDEEQSCLRYQQSRHAAALPLAAGQAIDTIVQFAFEVEARQCIIGALRIGRLAMRRSMIAADPEIAAGWAER